MKTLGYNVPFVANPSDKCVPATIGMVLSYFEPNQKFSMLQLEKLCGYQKGKGIWPFTHLLALTKRGYQIKCIEDFDLPQFIEDPVAYLRQILSHEPEALEFQLSHSNLHNEAKKAQKCLDNGLHFERRRGTPSDIKQLLDDGWLVRLEVNGMPLAEKPGFYAHSILVIGYDESGAILHNPDGAHGSKPNQHVSWELLDEAWGEYGGSYSMYGFKK